MRNELLLDRMESIDDTHRVCDSNDADAEPLAARKPYTHYDSLTEHGNRGLQVSRWRRQLDRDRIRLDARAVSAIRHARSLVLDPRFEIAVDGVDEVAAVILRVEAEDRAAEEPVQHARAPRADPERLRIGPRD